MDLLLHIRDHLLLAGAALAAALAVAVPIGGALARACLARSAWLSAIGTARVIPSLAVLALMLPLIGIGFAPAFVALTLLAIPPIAINTDLGLRGVPPAMREAARGLGMSERQIRMRVDWPLALPVVFSGIRIATVEVIASASLAGFIGGGGLGEYIINALAANQMGQLLEGAGSVAVLALLAAGTLGASALVAGCNRPATNAVAIGSKDFTEELILGEMYAQILEKHGLAVSRKLNLGGTQVAMEALLRGDIDLYPEYTGTGLITELKLKPRGDAGSIYRTVKSEYERRYHLIWLDPAPMNETQALAMTQAGSAKYGVRTLSDLAKAAPQLRLGAIPEFTTREDALPGLQHADGRFQFKSVKLFDIGLKYKALETGQVDVVVP